MAQEKLANPFSLQSLNGEQDLAESMYVASQYNPDEMARSIRLADEENLPLSTAQRNYQELQRRQSVRRLNFQIDENNNPKSADWFKDPDNASIAHDIAPIFPKIEGLLPTRPTDYIRSGVGGAISTVGGALTGLGRQGETIMGSGNDLAKVLGLGESDIAPYLEAIPNILLTRPGNYIQSLGRDISAPEVRQSMGTDIASGVGQIIPSAASFALGGPIFGTYAALSSSQGQTSYGYDIKGYEDTPVRRTAELISGSFEGLTEKFALGPLLDGLPLPARNAVKNQVSEYLARMGVSAGIVQNPLVRIGEAGAAEFAQEFTSGVLQNLTEKVSLNPDVKLLDNAPEGAVAAGGAAAIMRSIVETAIGINKSRNDRINETAEMAKQPFKQLHELMQSPEAQKMKLNRSEPRLREFLKSADNEQLVYISPEPLIKLYQALDGEERQRIDLNLPDFARHIQEAEVAGNDVILRQGDYATYIASLAEFNSLVDHVKFSPDSLTAAQIKELTENPEIERDLREVQADIENIRSRERELQDMLQNAGVPPRIAQTQAQLLSAMRQTIPGRLGVNPEELNPQFGVQRLLTIEPDQRNERLDSLRKYATKEKAVKAKKSPILAYLKKRGGLKLEGPDAGDLKAMGIEAKTVPGLFKKKGGKGLDNIPISEFRSAFPEAGIPTDRDNNGYVDVNWLKEKIRDEFMADGQVDETLENDLQFLNERGIDISAENNADILRKLQEAGVETGQTTLYQITPEQALETNVPVDLPKDQIFAEAVSNTPGASITADGLRINLTRFQKTEQEGGQSVRTGVFYLPSKSKDARHYRGESTTYGGIEKFEGETIIRRPLFVKGATGGKAPEAAFSQLKGKDALKKLDSDVFGAINQRYGVFGGDKELFEEKVKDLLKEYGANQNLAWEIINNSTKGNQLRYALQENIIAHVVRDAGYDAVVGYSKGRNGKGHFISEIFDVREQTYPARGMDSEIHEKFLQEERGSISFDKDLEKVVISLTSNANLSTLAHEMGHYGSLLLRKAATAAQEKLADSGEGQDNAQLEQLVKDWESLKKFVGAEGDTLTVEQEEQIAKAFEQYMREGKAPSSGLKQVFAAFKSWLLQIYKSIVSLGKPINEEVRQVFDRWLATDEEIASASEINLTIEEISKAFDGDIPAKVARLLNKSGVDASTELLSEYVREENKRQTEEYKAEEEKIRAEVTEFADNKASFKALEYIQDNHKLTLSKEQAEGFRGKLPRGITGGETNPDEVAALYGFKDGNDLLRSIAENPNKKKYIEAETERLMKERHGNMFEDGRATERARQLAASDEVGQAIDLLVRASGNKSATRKLVMLAAKQRMGETKMSEIVPHRYEQARDKHIRAAFKSGVRGKGGKAGEHLWKAMLNHELFRAANEAKQEYNKATDLFQKINQKDKNLPKNWPGDYVYFARTILARNNLSRPERFNAQKWLSEVLANDVNLRDQLVSLGNVEAIPQVDWKELTLEQFKTLHDSVKNIIHVGRQTLELQLGVEKIMIDQAVDRILDSLARNGYKTLPPALASTLTGTEKALKFGYKLESSLVRIEQLAKHLDGGTIDGPMSQLIYRPIADAVNKGKPLEKEFIERLAKLMSEREAVYANSGSLEIPALATENFNGKFRSKWDLVVALLNYGNQSNLDKMLDGYGWTEENLKQALAQYLTKDDVDFAQKIWDMLDEVKVYVKEEHRQRTGLQLAEIEPRSFELFGTTYRGGYYPVVYDADKSLDIMSKLEREQALTGANQYQWPSVAKGHTKERSEFVAPISFDPMHSIRHVEKAIHLWAVGRTVRDVARLTNRKEFRQAMRAINPAYESIWHPWLQAVARDTVDDVAQASDPLQRAAKVLRNRATIMIMGGNLLNAVQNLSGYPIVADEIGVEWMGRGLRDFTQDRKGSLEFVKSRSIEMRMRYENLDREMQEALRNIQIGNTSAVQRMAGKLTPYAFVMSNFTDSLVSVPSWLGAYQKALKQGKDETDAAYYADSVVRTRVGSGSVKDTAQIQRGNQYARTALAMFYSYMNMVYNLNRTQFLKLKMQGIKGMPEFLAGQLMVNILPNMIAAGLVDAFGGGGSEADDEEKWMWWYTKRALMGWFGLVPLVNNIGNAALSAVDNNPFNDRAIATPVGSMLGTAVNTVGQLTGAFSKENPNWSQITKDTIATASAISGLPLGYVKNPMATLVDWSEGDSEPQGLLDAIQRLSGGPAPKSSN